MKAIDRKSLKPGMILAKDVHVNAQKIVLLSKGDIISRKDLAKLAFYSIDEVYIEDEIVTVSTNESDANYNGSYTRLDRIKATPEFQEFKKSFEECSESFKNSINDVILKSKEFKVGDLMAPIYRLLKKNPNTNVVFDMLHNLREYDDATYTHCINVALISNILAKWLKMDDTEIDIATQAGLFHDIGKVMIPEDIIKKPGKLTEKEYEEIKKHPQIGYDVLKDQPVSNHVKNAALMHHERCDGTGYPQGLKAPQIDRYAKLVSIADVYDAMTSARYYREPLCPFTAIELFEENGFTKYDSEMIMTFLKNIVNTYISSTVKLSSGEIGEIIFVNQDSLSKPTVRIGDDYIDLSKRKGVTIEKIL
ncbi:HDIG domain-containing protein [Butyrivibrio proteoclasticus]|uniref:HDIG domain-containing protein n=1 Tax=Butyrivibrio proteoclasticus TaxID=43305 RepID=A0A1I5VQC5_9FIRM|nr:HD-GYP domain-containing protein [Butyrivibrio proteoclasticus]SFQ09623.1 HDIG domain-containing protein [Butyrivibrio proteoclasticus]